MSDHQINPTGPESAPQKKAPSPAKLAANRSNSKSSTGPKTVAGKAEVSKHALKSGVYAQKWLAVTGEEQHMVNHVLGQLRQQYPARDLLDEVEHELFVQAYVRRWRYIQADGGMIDARRGQIECDRTTADTLAGIEELQCTLTTATEQLERTGRVTSDTLNTLERFSKVKPAAVLVGELKRIAPEGAQPEEATDITQALRLAEDLAQFLKRGKAEAETRIAKQENAAYRQAALPGDAEAKNFLRHERDTSRGLRRAAGSIERRWGRAPILQRQERKIA